MRFRTEQEAIAFIFRSRRKLDAAPRGLDEHTRSITPTRNLMLALNLPADKEREGVVITGSKGKGSTAAITAKLLEHIGHKTGLITSPHLVSWYERIRINGRAIPQADFLRILSDIAPAIEIEEAKLTGNQYISPQGIFLLIALRWFDEQDVAVAVGEVGRGGRFDDISLLPHRVALFTPIFMEHAQYLGPSVERIAWHKAGIVPHGGWVYSVAQEPAALEVIQREADTRDAEFFWFSTLDMGQYLSDTAEGVRFSLNRYGEVNLPLLGRYQIANATLAVQAAGKLHGNLPGISHGSAEYVARIKAGLAAVRWPGRLQKLQDNPAVYVEGAINVLSARDFLKSVEARITQPLVIVAGVPRDRDFAAVYAVLAEKADALILTETDIHPNIHFPAKDDALAAAQAVHDDVQHTSNLPAALEAAYARAGSSGTVLLSVAQPLVGECMLIWNVDTTQI